ncbi:MAG: cation-transporting P-type ATPase [Theionarchaea archaeon]|nr:cation-transporting P-type ATPase [Theionarchaea archaeon]
MGKKNLHSNDENTKEKLKSHETLTHTEHTFFIPDNPWTESIDALVTGMDIDPEKGLSSKQVQERRHVFGKNELRTLEKASVLHIFIRQFESILVLLLLVATLLSFVFGKILEGVAITLVILINTILGFYTEWKAVRSMEALHQLTRVTAKVRRNGDVQIISAEQLVPGDLVVVEAGDIVTADMRLVSASRLQVNESALTGESLPVTKSLPPVDAAPLAERTNMLYKGTAVTRGSGEGVVIATGMQTELGKISALIEGEAEKETPLENRLEKLGHNLVWVTLAIVVIVGVTGIARGKDILLMIETAIALAVATVPEGLPMVATMTLARGMWRMARKHALINRLSAVETLGSTTIICTDKTGTLTENQMTVTTITLAHTSVEVTGTGLNTEGSFQAPQENRGADETLKKALQIAVLCNNASLNDESAVGDPTEIALLVAGEKAGMSRKEVIQSYPEVREVSFDPSLNMMATFHEENGAYMVAVKGAPEAVLGVCTSVLTPQGAVSLSVEEKDTWLYKNKSMAEDGLRVLAVATKSVESPSEEPYEALTLVGLLGLMDPPREDVKPSIRACQKAGIRVIMVTGDQAATAVYVGKTLGLLDEHASIVEGEALPEDITNLSAEEKDHLASISLFARVTPAQKLTLVDIHQERDEIVAMTGDGINDAPALQKADIGIAMGTRGTQVAKEAADMILQDDNFSTITSAVEQGRIIFTNIRKFIYYLLSCNISEILVIFLASLLYTHLPVLPLQILFLNVVTDIFPAFALGWGHGSAHIMELPPRHPKTPILTRKHWAGISVYSAVITISVLSAFFLALFRYQMEISRVVTISFLTLAFAQLWHVFNMREKGSSFIRNEVTVNRYVWGALLLCTGLLLAATYLPGLNTVLETVSPGKTGWIIIMGMSVIPLIAGQIWNSLPGNS